MDQDGASGSAETDRKYPGVPMVGIKQTRIVLRKKYAPSTIRGLKQGEVKLWCACGLSKKQPWCDGSHKGTGIKPLKWTVPVQQTLYQICLCKYSESKPYCDGTHVNLPCTVLERQAQCQNKVGHTDSCKLCTGCGWVPDF